MKKVNIRQENDNLKFSVLMSVYIKEEPEYLDEALESVLVEQSLIPNELVLVKDGPLTEELEKVINKYYIKFSSILKIVPISSNVGLGKALNIGLEKCNHNLVARMDSDDICSFNRFQKQIEHFKINPSLDLVGSNIIEFFYSPKNPQFIKKLPNDIEGIKKMMKRRNSINHVSVMFKKDKVLKAGGYMHLPYLEDYYLWVRMLNNNCILANFDEDLVYVRTGKDMFKRRGNREYIKSWFKLQKVMKSYNQINILDVVINMLNIIVFVNTRPTIKQLIYKLFLRQSGINEVE